MILIIDAAPYGIKKHRALIKTLCKQLEFEEPTIKGAGVLKTARTVIHDCGVVNEPLLVISEVLIERDGKQVSLRPFLKQLWNGSVEAVPALPTVLPIIVYASDPKLGKVPPRPPNAIINKNTSVGEEPHKLLLGALREGLIELHRAGQQAAGNYGSQLYGN